MNPEQNVHSNIANIKNTLTNSSLSGQVCKAAKNVRTDDMSVLSLKQELTTQLCGLLLCVFQCLDGGQTFQYSSMLIVNRIIDSFICFESCFVPLNINKTSDFDFYDARTAHRLLINEKAEKASSSAAITAAANIGKHFRNLRINDSFNFKQKEVKIAKQDKSAEDKHKQKAMPKQT